jgi:hypothetical protein
MERLTEEEAKEFIPCSEDYSNNPPAYFTIKTSSDGWDELTYYTCKKRGLYVGRMVMNGFMSYLILRCREC